MFNYDLHRPPKYLARRPNGGAILALLIGKLATEGIANMAGKPFNAYARQTEANHPI